MSLLILAAMRDNSEALKACPRCAIGPIAKFNASAMRGANRQISSSSSYAGATMTGTIDNREFAIKKVIGFIRKTGYFSSTGLGAGGSVSTGFSGAAGSGAVAVSAVSSSLGGAAVISLSISICVNATPMIAMRINPILDIVRRGVPKKAPAIEND